MNKRKWIIAGLALILAVVVGVVFRPSPVQKTLTVFAASSFAYVLHENESLIEAETGIAITIVEAASSTLAHQVNGGAPADIFITADDTWMTYLKDRGHYESTPMKIAQNRLVLVFSAPVVSFCNVHFFAPPTAPDLLGACPYPDLVATGDPAYVPLGKYAMQTIEFYNWNLNLAPATNARAALALLESGGTGAGILYKTDVITSGSDWPRFEIPQSSHAQINYFAAQLVKSEVEMSKKFLDFLASPDFKTILQSKGFEVN